MTLWGQLLLLHRKWHHGSLGSELAFCSATHQPSTRLQPSCACLELLLKSGFWPRKPGGGLHPPQEHPHTPPAPPCAGPEPEPGCRTPVRHGWVSSLTVGLSPASSQSTSTSSLPLLSPSVTLSREIFLQLLALRLPAPIFRGHGSLALSTLLCWVLFLALPARFTHCHLFWVQLRNIPDLLGFVCLRGFACFPKCIIHFDVSKLLLLAPPPF